ncbi:hypothetical protein J6590_012160 [Homalodisca vitripennis]|nr:hypothetical protein J6590_012160 [Homalodisca vitripennis]
MYCTRRITAFFIPHLPQTNNAKTSSCTAYFFGPGLAAAATSRLAIATCKVFVYFHER